jgi:hypothetical protein
MSTETDYEGDQLLFEDKPKQKKNHLKKEKESLHEEEHKESKKQSSTQKKHTPDRGYKEIKIRITPFLIERIIYWIVIIILAFFLIRGTGCNLDFGSKIASANPAIVSAETNLDITTAPESNIEVTAEKAYLIKDGKCVENSSLNNADSEIYATKLSCEKALADAQKAQETCPAGQAEIEIKEVLMEADNEKKIKSIEVLIYNKDNKDLKNFIISLVWYNSDLEDIVKITPKLKQMGSNVAGDRIYNTTLIPKCIGLNTIKFDKELASTFVTTREIDNTFEITLKDSSGKKLSTDTYVLKKK